MEKTNNNLLYAMIAGFCLMIYFYAKKQGKENANKSAGITPDTSILENQLSRSYEEWNSFAIAFEAEIGSTFVDETKVINMCKQFKSNKDIEYVANTIGEISWALYGSDMFERLNYILSHDEKAQIKPYLFNYASKID